jgi:hypothetical protein
MFFFIGAFTTQVSYKTNKPSKNMTKLSTEATISLQKTEGTMSAQKP